MQFFSNIQESENGENEEEEILLPDDPEISLRHIKNNQQECIPKQSRLSDIVGNNKKR